MRHSPSLVMSFPHGYLNALTPLDFSLALMASYKELHTDEEEDEWGTQ